MKNVNGAHGQLAGAGFGRHPRERGGSHSIIGGTGGSPTDTTDANHAPVDVLSYP